MIEYIRGAIAELQPAVAIIEAAGIGYEVNITLSDFSALQGFGSEPVTVYIHEVIREDSHTLYGFLRREARQMFRLLTTVSGVGPGTARLILSEFSAPELQSIIASGNDSALKSVKGIGARTAQRIIVDLGNKIKDLPTALDTTEGVTAASTSVMADATGALTTLGFPAPAVHKVLRKVLGANPTLSTEEAIRAALKMF